MIPALSGRLVDTLIRCLDAQDDFTQLKAAQILTVLLRSASLFFLCLPVALELITVSAEQQCDVLQRHLQLFLQVLAQFVTSPSPHKRDVGAQCLESLLARQQVRQAVWVNSAIIPG